jgi:hypothetical protein
MGEAFDQTAAEAAPSLRESWNNAVAGLKTAWGKVTDFNRTRPKIAATILGGTVALTGSFAVVSVAAVKMYDLYKNRIADVTPDFNADGIVVFTGGSGRVATALKECGPDQKLLISGCRPGNTLHDIMRASKLSLWELALARNNVTIGTRALTTEGNIQELADWLNKNPDIRRLVIYTSDYHEPLVACLIEKSDNFPRNVELRFRLIQPQSVPVTTTAEEVVKTYLASWEVPYGSNTLRAEEPHSPARN